ncbi:MAG: hypothetical protein HY693_04130 [Deltaproteobacteria bacterium]|nr:hypothetical protein [Deltaproteobacteria bacterium]
MNWEYKIIPWDELISNYEDHDIAVSKQAASSRRSKIGKGLEQNLNQQGDLGWELITIFGEFGIFKKPKA